MPTSQSYVNGTAVGASGGSGPSLSTATPAALSYGGAGTAGSASTASKGDHVHPLGAVTAVGSAGSATTYTGGGVLQRTATSGNLTAGAGDYYVGVTSTAAPYTITIPGAAASGRTLVIQDESGAAATNNITVTPASGTINGAASYVIKTNYGRVGLMSDGTNWFGG